MTAVERFAQRHEAGDTPPAGCYEALIPLARPAAGEQYGFRVDLDACTGLQGLRRRLPQPERPGRRRGLAQRRPAARRVEPRARAADGHDRLPPLPRPGVHERLPGEGLREGSRRPASSATSTTSASAASTACSPARTRCRSSTASAASCASATCAATGSRRARRPPACRRAPTRRSRSRSSTSRARSRTRRRGTSCRARRRPRSPSRRPNTSRKRAFPRNLLPADFYQVRAGHPHLPLVFMLVLTQLSVGAFAVEFLLRAAVFAAARVRARATTRHRARAPGCWRWARACFTWGGRNTRSARSSACAPPGCRARSSRSARLRARRRRTRRTSGAGRCWRRCTCRRCRAGWRRPRAADAAGHAASC